MPVDVEEACGAALRHMFPYQQSKGTHSCSSYLVAHGGTA